MGTGYMKNGVWNSGEWGRDLTDFFQIKDKK
jgi:hypothetical protein